MLRRKISVFTPLRTSMVNVKDAIRFSRNKRCGSTQSIAAAANVEKGGIPGSSVAVARLAAIKRFSAGGTVRLTRHARDARNWWANSATSAASSAAAVRRRSVHPFTKHGLGPTHLPHLSEDDALGLSSVGPRSDHDPPDFIRDLVAAAIA